MDVYAKEHGIAIPRGPMIVLSGAVEGRVSQDTNYVKTSKTDVELSLAELDIYGEVNSWATAAMIISYDDSADTDSSNVARYNNSRLLIDRAFLTFGQLSKCPVYASIGQLYAPFGNYGGYRLTLSGTRTLGRVKDRMVVVGYEDSGFFAQVYGFAGETKKETGSEAFRHSGASVGYTYQGDNAKLHVSGGVLGNLAESQGMQKNIFGKSVSAETITSRVLGYTGFAKLSAYDFDLIAEYVGASKDFDTADLAFNGHGAKPQALDFGTAYNFKVKGKPSAVFATYVLTSQALALDLPKHSFGAGCSTAFMKNTLAILEYRHDINYGWNDTATSTAGIAGAKVSGRHSNVVTLQLGVYF
jgi:hypothetical protein